MNVNSAPIENVELFTNWKNVNRMNQQNVICIMCRFFYFIFNGKVYATDIFSVTKKEKTR